MKIKKAKTQNHSRDRGAVMIWFAASTVVFLGMGALVIDVGALYSERRQLQNGADAAALAVAIECAVGPCSAPRQVAEQYADLNAADKASAVDDICGAPNPLPFCPPPPQAENALGYVKVVTGTRNNGGGASDEIKYLFAPALDGANIGKHVTASAIAAWGSPVGAPIMPFVFTKCVLEPFRTGNGTMNFPPVVSMLKFHNYTGDLDPLDPEQVCNSGQSDIGLKWPAGFGFTGSASTGCASEVVNLDPGVGSQTGTIEGENNGNAGSSSCKDELIRRFLAGEQALVPVMTWRVGDGGKTIWSIDGFVAITICAFDLVGSDRLDLDACKTMGGLTGNLACAGGKVKGQSPRRICGIFEVYTLTTGEIGNSTDYGTRVIALVG